MVVGDRGEDILDTCRLFVGQRCVHGITINFLILIKLDFVPPVPLGSLERNAGKNNNLTYWMDGVYEPYIYRSIDQTDRHG